MIIVTPSIQVDRKNNMMILTARSIDDPSYPATNDYVRVQEYRSQMFIRPHKSFDEKGFDYVMSLNTEKNSVKNAHSNYCTRK